MELESTIQGMTPQQQAEWQQIYQHFRKNGVSLEHAREFADSSARTSGYGEQPITNRAVHSIPQMPAVGPVPTPRSPSVPRSPFAEKGPRLPQPQPVDPQSVASIQPPVPPQASAPVPTPRPFTGGVPVPIPQPRPLTELAQGPAQGSIMNAFSGQVPTPTPRPENRLAALQTRSIPSPAPRPDIEPGAMRTGLPVLSPAPRSDIEPGTMRAGLPLPSPAPRPSLPDIEPGAMRAGPAVPTPRPSGNSIMTAFPADPRLKLRVGSLAGPRVDNVQTASTGPAAAPSPRPRPQQTQQPQQPLPQQPRMSDEVRERRDALAAFRRGDRIAPQMQFGNQALAEALMRKRQIGLR